MTTPGTLPTLVDLDLPRGTFHTPHGIYTFQPHAATSTMPADSDSDATPLVGATFPGLQGPPPTDPAAVAAVAAALAVQAARTNSVTHLHVVTGIPPGLAALLRSTGPWTADVLYSVAPTGPLTAVEEEDPPAPEWYCVSRGRFVGVLSEYAQAHWAIRSISNAAHKTYTSQTLALRAFNKIVGWGGIEVV